MNKMASMYGRSRAPLYVQIASVMRHRIESGRWAQGEKISTLEQLEREFSVARVTIRQAIDMLREEGLLDAQQGRGTFVSGRPRRNRWLNLPTDFDAFLRCVEENVLQRVQIDENVAPPELEPGEGRPAAAYSFLRSVQYNDDEPFSVVNLYLDREIFLREREYFLHHASLPRIVAMPETTIVRAPQTLTIGIADPETAELLGIGLAEPTADCRLVLVDSNDVAIYVANIHYHRNCFTLHLDLMAQRSRPA